MAKCCTILLFLGLFAGILFPTAGIVIYPVSAAGETIQPTATPVDANSLFSDLFSGNAWDPAASIAESAMQISGRLLLAVTLSGILALRPRGNIRLFRRNLHVSQTEILLSVVAAALMMVVGDNAARAFGIFAAVSIVRFRTNIRDPKEITVLLISLALGLAAGVGRWELGIALCLFSLILLWALERNESGQVFRSMQLRVKAHNMREMQEILKKIFDGRQIEAEVRQFDPANEKRSYGSMVYNINLPLNISTDEISEEILTASSERLEGIEWEPQKTQADMYQ
jgi:hypothetical protein